MMGSPYSKRLETTVVKNFFHKSVGVNLTRWWYETTYYKKGNSNTHTVQKILNNLLGGNPAKSIFNDKL
jgi:hypothetical protein